MKKLFPLLLFSTLLNLIFNNLLSQNTIPFGEISNKDLENGTYSPDPGADAITLSDEGIASLNSDGREFYVEYVRDVKIKIVNSMGFDYASVSLPFYSNEVVLSYRASTFNLKNGEKTETVIPKKSFIFDRASDDVKFLKFNFTDVHEGSIIEYSYSVRLNSSAVYELVPWAFQSELPVVRSTLTVVYPDYFTFKNTITGAVNKVNFNASSTESMFYRERVKFNFLSWNVQDMPAYKNEPYTKSWRENLTKINFELSSTNFPGSTIEEITPSYETLTKKLLESDNFGEALSRTGFLKKKALELTSGLGNNLSKVKAIHEFISNKILWNGVESFSTSASLRRIYFKEKGNSADINLMFIGMLRAINIKANPVLLSTRSNGSISTYSAMIQQFNYVVAYVYADGEYYLVDATDPLRPFDVLPFECLNGKGRVIDEYDAKFIDLKNKETNVSKTNVSLLLDDNGNLAGEMQIRYSDYYANDLRKSIILEGEEGYLDGIKSNNSELEISGLKFENLAKRDSDVIETFYLKIDNGAQVAGNKLLLNPFFSFLALENDFYAETRNFPIDFGTPYNIEVVMHLEIPEGYSLIEKPANARYNLGQGEATYSFSCEYGDKMVEIKSQLSINKTVFLPVNYLMVQDFYSRIIRKQSELLVFNKNL